MRNFLQLSKSRWVNLCKCQFVGLIGVGSLPLVVVETEALAKCTDELDVDMRIAKASAAFGSLSKCVFTANGITAEAKSIAYKTLVLSILLYGSESWALTQKMWTKLRAFHNTDLDIQASTNFGRFFTISLC